VFEVVSLDETDAMFTSDGTFHLHGTLHHPVNNTLGCLLFAIIEQNDG
jgi:hypothetical protein